MARGRKKKLPIHPSIRAALGYDAADTDEAVYADWKARTSRVCKPCWELKYCPYGPLVEQSPTLPTRRKDVEEQRGYFEECLKSGLVGNVVPLADEWRDLLEQWCQDEQLLLQQAYTSIVNARRLSMAETLETEEEQIDAWLGSGRLPPIQVYRTQFEYGNDELGCGRFLPRGMG